ncbi:MAG: type V CRISPR-associated protein Cas12d, partial [Patescibacteria group bacterium]|nr:type V CRISPR-associated protein Cas12d [Patescibacteria group bacterium]
KENEVKINQFINHKLYLGIDAGEYGIAYCLTDFSQQNPKIIEANYIKSKNIRKIKDHYHKIQERAKKGLFLSSTSILQEIRENSINEIRNKIHNLYIKYQSPIIYEYSISNFETGSGRITKIYDSIKKSDTIPDNDADKLVIKHIWGVDFLESGKIGKNLSAYGSSYTCSACGKSIYSLFENFEKDNILVLKKLNSNNIKNIIEIKTNYGIIYGYTRDNKFIENYQFEKTKESKNEFIKIIKSFTRPPLEKSEVLISFKKLNKKILKKIKKERGNSAVFVCPFKDCGHVFDADLQAAFIMSIRGFIKDIFKDRKDLNIFEETINYLNNKKINLELLKNQDLFSLLESKNQ